MKKFLMCALLAVSMSGCTFKQINPGHVGVVVPMTGDQRGVKPQVDGPGWHVYSWTTRIYEYPIFQQNYTWTAAVHEGRPVNERILVNSKEGSEVGLDVAIQYQIPSDKVPLVFQTFRTGIEEITHGLLRTKVRNAFADTTSNYTVEQLYSTALATAVKEAEVKTRKEMEPYGIEVLSISLVERPHFDSKIEDQIKAKVESIQIAERKENELRAIRAEAAKQVAEAEGSAKVAVAQAEGQRAAQIAQAEGESKANQLRTNSITPAIIRMRELDIEMVKAQKWSGYYPQTMAGSGASLILDARKVAAEK